MNVEIELDDRRILHAEVFVTDNGSTVDVENIEIQYFDERNWDEWYLPRPKDIERYEKMIRDWYFQQQRAG